MVKIKEGYVMSAREQAEFDRVNALPRKTSGTVAYYYKPPTKYPARIYVFMHAEVWCDRNRRPMGLFHAFPFLKRAMNREEIEYHHFDTRLCYHQYEDWDKLIYAEEREASQLDTEREGTGKAFLEKLKSFRTRYAIGMGEKTQKAVRGEPEEDSTSAYMRHLIQNGSNYSVTEIGVMLRDEQDGQKRTVILILLRELYKQLAGDGKHTLELKPENIIRKAKIVEDRRRRNFVRRTYAANPLFALAEIAGRYPGYDEKSLLADLKQKTHTTRRPKCKPLVDLRRCQLQKLAGELQRLKDDEKAYSTICQRMAMLGEAHRLRQPIPVTVKLQGEIRVYDFHWKTRESVVKSFVSRANQKSMTHAELQGHYQQIISSNYSF